MDLRRRGVYITRGVYSGTPFTGYALVAKAGEEERGFGPSNVARGLVYSRASDDNVHAALNLSLLPPSSREPGSRFPSLSFLFFTLALYHIPFLPSYVPECRVAARPRPPRLLHPFFLLSFVCVDLLFLFPSLCSYFIRAGVSSRRGESAHITRDTSSYGDALTRGANIYVLVIMTISRRGGLVSICREFSEHRLIWFPKPSDLLFIIVNLKKIRRWYTFQLLRLYGY